MQYSDEWLATQRSEMYARLQSRDAELISELNSLANRVQVLEEICHILMARTKRIERNGHEVHS